MTPELKWWMFAALYVAFALSVAAGAAMLEKEERR